MLDLFGKTIFDYQTQTNSENIFTETNISELDEMDISYMFRSFDAMPPIEQKALRLCKGKILDVGCGAGSHSLYLQNQAKLDVTAIDISEKSIETCKLRGVKKAKVQHLLDVEEKFDTILLLMNGTGIFRKLTEISAYLQKLKSIINTNGQILIDSSDIIYMFDEEADGSRWIPADGYYGELDFTIHYQGEKESFPWLYLDYNTLQNACFANGLQCKLLYEGNHFDYLAQLFI